MPTTLPCPQCGKPLTLTDDLRGRRVQCGNCRSVLIVDTNLAVSVDRTPIVGQPSVFEPMSEEARPAPRKSNTALILIIVAGAFGVMIVCGGILMALLLPAVQQAREAARRTECKNNLKQIGIALHSYHDQYSAFPPAFIPDAQGKPMHSWRVLILPFLEQDQLYSEYDFSEPWDGPKNRLLLTRMPSVYACPSHDSRDHTTTAYAAVFGKDCAFPGSEGVNIRAFKDGLSQTILVGEAVKANIPWTKPEDVDVSIHGRVGDPAGFGSKHAGGFQALLGDGSVRFISNNINQTVFDGICTINGNEHWMDF